MDAVPECVRCRRSEADHDLRDTVGAAGVDDVKRRIWKALGWPCAQFTRTPAEIYAANQAATSRWDLGRRHQDAAGSRNQETARRGAAKAREQLGLTSQDDTKEAS